MATTVKVLAKELKRTAPDLLEQLKAAGIEKGSEDDSITEKDKTVLLEHLQKEHGSADTGSRKKITLIKRENSEIRQADSAGRTRTVQVEVRKKRVLVKAGDKAPNFSGLDQNGATHTLADYKGKKLVVFFYPKANTPGCTAEACDLRDNFERFQANNYALLGVSADSQKAQAKFKDKYEFPFPLLADEDKSVIQAFGVWGPKNSWAKNMTVFTEPHL